MRVVAVFIFAALPIAAFAQSATPSLSITLSPSQGSASTERVAQISGMSANESEVLVLLSPEGSEQVTNVQADASGTASVTLAPPAVGWQQGIYRAAIRNTASRTASATFVVSDGTPRLLVEPDLPSPTSAFNFQGIGLPPQQQFTVVLDLTGGETGQFTQTVTTDANGSFSTLVFPQQAGVSFFAAGVYRVSLPQAGLSVPFTVREHPVSAYLTAGSAALSGADLDIHLQNYQGNRYVWGVLADPNGQPVSEFLAGPTDASGSGEAALVLPQLAAGRYFLATPYDWGETTLEVLQPTATETPPATGTPLPTVTPTRTTVPTPRATATPKRVTCRSHYHRVRGKCVRIKPRIERHRHCTRWKHHKCLRWKS